MGKLCRLPWTALYLICLFSMKAVLSVHRLMIITRNNDTLFDITKYLWITWHYHINILPSVVSMRRSVIYSSTSFADHFQTKFDRNRSTIIVELVQRTSDYKDRLLGVVFRPGSDKLLSTLSRYVTIYNKVAANGKGKFIPTYLHSNLKNAVYFR